VNTFELQKRVEHLEQALRLARRQRDEAVERYSEELREVVNALRECASEGRPSAHTVQVLHKHCSE
jgi:hypothetical protein